MKSSLLNKIKIPKAFWVGMITMGLLAFFIQGKTPDSYFESSKNMEIFATMFKELNTYYVDPIEPGKMVKTGIDAMLDDLDPYTNYITEADIENYEFQTTGKYGGIGAIMRKKGDDIVVGDVYENSPAQKVGLHPGDVVIAIDDHLLKGKSIEDISLLLKGSPGTQVTVKVRDVYNNQETTKIITRGEIELSSVPFAGLVGSKKNIAFVRLTQFTPGCSRLVRNALDSLKTVQKDLKGVVLDLRNNPGGLLDEAVNICNLFIDRGQLVVSTKGKMQDWDKDFKTSGVSWDTQIPLAVIVNHSSASASEIVAGTMQDLDRGVIIGERSYGKGLVQTTRPLGYNARLKLTTAKYYTPSGRCIQALDYTHRNSDGSVSAMADSLKKEFKTKSGRKVLSGGGVEPDVKISDKPISRLAITIYTKNYFFDYATNYVKAHNTVASADKFTLSSAEFSNFVKWLDGKEYSYKTDTEIALDSLKQTAVRDKNFDVIKGEFAALQAKLNHDKKQDIIKYQQELTHLLEGEIVSRYFFQHGRIEQSLIADDDLAKALEVLGSPDAYQAILQPKKK